MNSYLITGGAGFIGSHLVEKLVGAGYHVIILDNFSSGKKDNISLACASSVEFIDGDVRDAQLVNSIVSRVDGVFHLAALVSVPRSVEEPGLSFDINARGTQIILDAARKADCTKVVIASSAAVYGNNVEVPLTENSTLAPVSPYGLEKLFGEHLASMYVELYDIDVTALRFFNVFGPRQDPSSPYSGVISIFIDKLLSGEPPTIFGDGNQTRDFVYVEDVATVALKAMLSESRGFNVYNLGSGKSVSINTLWEMLREGAGVLINPRFKEERANDIRFSVADISLLTQQLTYTPRVGLAEGLRRTYEWTKQ